MIIDPIPAELNSSNVAVVGRPCPSAERVKMQNFLKVLRQQICYFFPLHSKNMAAGAHCSALTGIDYGTLTNNWRTLHSFTLRFIAAGILVRIDRLNSSSHHDESNWASANVD